jgi:hypothetical protein
MYPRRDVDAEQSRHERIHGFSSLATLPWLERRIASETLALAQFPEQVRL